MTTTSMSSDLPGLVSPLICEHCLANNELRAEVVSRGVVVSSCAVCGHSGGRALPCDDDTVKRTFRALIRLHFSEWQYNTHLGGESLQEVVRQSSAIFNLGTRASEEEFESAFLTLEEDWYPKSADQIALGGGYWEGGVLWGLRDQRDAQVSRILRDALSQNYFDVVPTARDLLMTLRPHLETVVATGTVFARGRVGVKSRLVPMDASPISQLPRFSYLPYTGKEIGAPPTALVGAGRLNRAHVSILYVASDSATAIAELRPHPGHMISTAAFRAKRNIRVASFAGQDIRNYLSDDKLEVLRAILSVSDVLDLPVQPDQQHLYSATQLLSDAIREEGFEGVSFKSSVGPGVNLACFDPDAFELVEGSEEAYEVTHLSYGIERAEVQGPAYDSDKFAPDSGDPVSNLVHGMSKRARRS
jgi:hypothetical protein